MAEDEKKDAKVDLDQLRWLWGLVRPYTGRLVVVFVCMVLSGGVSLVLPWVAGDVVDETLRKNLESMKVIVLGLIGLFAVSAGLDFLESYILRATSARLLVGLRLRLHAHLLELTPAFFETQRTGDLLSRLESDIDRIGATLTDRLVGGLQQGLVLIGAVAILFILQPWLTGVMLLAVPPVIIAAVLFGARFQKLSTEEQEAVAQANVVAEESLSGIRTVQAFAREPHERTRYAERQEKAVAIALRAAVTWGVFGSVVSFLAFTAVTVVLYVGGRMVVNGQLTPGQLVSFILITLTVAGAVGSLTALWGALKSAAGATQRVREILDTPPAVADAPGAAPLGRPRGHVSYEGVSFSYPVKEKGEVRLALSGIDLEVAPGQCVALVGPSGAGKSTIASLLLRFHDPTAGSVSLDGKDLRAVKLREVREAIGLVPQEILLFGGTVAENIRYGRLDATQEQVQAAAEAAQAHGFIAALPKGYETIVGERGIRLSAGERQRIAIARVFLKDPAVVVLDEATSSLDSESEHLVQRAFERLLEGRTTLVIAHRLATVRRAHRVVVLEKGRVREAGTHEELLVRSDLYRRLVELQMLEPAS